MSMRDGRPLADVPLSDDALAALSMAVFLAVAVAAIALAVIL